MLQRKGSFASMLSKNACDAGMKATFFNLFACAILGFI